MTKIYTAIKHDSNKDPWHLFPWDAAQQIVKVLEFGSRKYGERNWEAGMEYSRLFSAMQRHMISWWAFEDQDHESNLSHLAHAAACVLFLLTYETRGHVTYDDRPNKKKESD